MEYIGKTAIQLINSARDQLSALKTVPLLPSGTASVIYIETAGAEDAMDEILMDLIDITSEYGSDPDAAWALTGYSEIQKMHDFRHAAAETVIQFIEKNMHWISVSSSSDKTSFPGTDFLRNCFRDHAGALSSKSACICLCTY